MNPRDAAQAVLELIAEASTPPLTWCAGSRPTPRIHPLDQQQIPDPTSHWVDPQADTPLEAYAALRQLSASLPVRLLATEGLPAARHVFLSPSQRNQHSTP